MKQKKLMMLALMLVTFLLTGCVQKHRVQHHPSPTDTLYTESKAMDIYGQDPLRALQIIDSAEVVGNLSAFRARVNDQLQAGQAHNYAARYQAQELQMALQKENAAKSRNSLINIIIGLAFCFTLAFLFYFFRQRRVLKRKNRILVRQITEAMKYKDMYRKQSQNLPKEGEDASPSISGQDSPVPAPTSNASTADGQTPAKKSICTPKTHPITQKTNETPSGAVGGGFLSLQPPQPSHHRRTAFPQSRIRPACCYGTFPSVEGTHRHCLCTGQRLRFAGSLHHCLSCGICRPSAAPTTLAPYHTSSHRQWFFQYQSLRSRL